MECCNPQCLAKITTEKLCRKCLLVKYCSDQCRATDWTSHKKICKQSAFDIKDFLPSKHNKSLGKGAYGEVQLVQYIPTRQLYALKVIKKRNLSRSASLRMMYREISVQKKLIHTNIIRLHGHIEDIDNLYLILEYAEKGNLFHYIRRHKGLSESEAWKIFTQVCTGMSYLHQNSIIHRDLKPENVLLTSNHTVKICDFGWCAEGNSERSTYCGTLDYMAPEILKGYSYTNKVDIWALGVLLFEMTHGYPPFNAKTEAEKSRLIRQGNFKFDEKISLECKDLIKMILQDTPESRPEIFTVLKHPWVSKFLSEHYRDKFNLNELEPGNSIRIEDQEGIVIALQGLVCEISMPQGTQTWIIPELLLKILNSFPQPRERKDSENLISGENFSEKLSKDYPPSYKSSRGRPPRNPAISAIAVEKPKITAQNLSSQNSICLSPTLSQAARSESSNYGKESMSSGFSSGSAFSSSSGEPGKTSEVISEECIQSRMKELESLQMQLEGQKRSIVVQEKKKKKKSGFFAKLTGIFNIGCTNR